MTIFFPVAKASFSTFIRSTLRSLSLSISIHGKSDGKSTSGSLQARKRSDSSCSCGETAPTLPGENSAFKLQTSHPHDGEEVSHSCDEDGWSPAGSISSLLALFPSSVSIRSGRRGSTVPTSPSALTHAEEVNNF